MTEQWKCRYLGLAKQVASWSKDPSTQVGAVIVGDHGQVLSQGYNGFPRGIQDTPERLLDRPTKYKYVVHAEMNAIYNASLTGVSLKGSTIFVVGLPICSECAKAIIQVGIEHVITPAQVIPEKWQKSCDFAAELLMEAGVGYSTCESFK